MKSLITALAVGISKAQMYSSGHDAVLENASRLVQIVHEHPEDMVKVLVVDGELVVNDVLNRRSGLHGSKLIKLFNAKGISRVDFFSGLKAEEAADFMADVANAEGELATYPHIEAGVLRVNTNATIMPSHLEMAAFLEEQLAEAKSLYQGISPFRELEVAGLEDILANFLLTFRRGVHVLQLISPVRSHSEYTYTHAMNVAVLSISMAEAMGLTEEQVLDVGLAAMMHDVGKLFVSKETLHKQDKLTADEFEHIKQHSMLGAAYLLKLEGMPRLAAVVALEHHLRFDCTGYPTLRRGIGGQHPASQIVAVCDVFDALRSCRPYRRDLSAEEVLRILREGEGTAFNPDLLDEFAAIIASAL